MIETKIVEFDFEESRRKDLEKEIDDLILVAETFYTRITKWSPDIPESEAKKIALNIAVARRYEPSFDISTRAIDHHLENIATSLFEICQRLEKP
jgi:hypothetical protein